MAISFLSVAKKNFLILLNSRLSFLILLFGPLFLIFVTGAALQDNSLGSLTAGVVLHDEAGNVFMGGDEFYEQFQQQLRDQSFDVLVESSLEACRSNVIYANSHVCVEVVRKAPPDFPVDELESNYYDVVAHADMSKARVTGEVIGRVQTAVEKQSSAMIRSKLLEARTRLESFTGSLYEVQSQLNEVDSYISQAQSGLDSARSEVTRIQTSLSSLSYELDNSFNKISYLINYLEANSEDPYAAYLLSQLYDVQSSISRARQQISDTRAIVSDGASINLFIDEAQRNLNLVQTRIDNVKTNLDDALEEWERINEEDLKELATPLTFSYKPISSMYSPNDLESIELAPKVEFDFSKVGEPVKSFNFFDYVFPSFLVFFIIFVSMLFATIVSVRERTSNAYVRNVTSRVSGFSFLLGNYVSLVVILIVQIFLMLFLSSFFLHSNAFSFFLPLLYFSFIGILLFVLVGMLLGHVFHSQESAAIASVSFSLLFILFLPLITPSETLPFPFSFFVSLAPFVILEAKIKLASIFGVWAPFSAVEIFSFLFWFFVSIGLLTLFYFVNKRKEL